VRVFPCRVHTPAELATLALQNKRQIYDLLFRATTDILRRRSRTQQIIAQYFSGPAAVSLKQWDAKMLEAARQWAKDGKPMAAALWGKEPEK
jgi:hypothetical protein